MKPKDKFIFLSTTQTLCPLTTSPNPSHCHIPFPPIQTSFCYHVVGGGGGAMSFELRTIDSTLRRLD